MCVSLFCVSFFGRRRFVCMSLCCVWFIGLDSLNVLRPPFCTSVCVSLFGVFFLWEEEVRVCEFVVCVVYWEEEVRVCEFVLCVVY